MFNIGGGQLLVILLVALLVLGPDKLPEAAKTAGKVMRQVRNVSAGFQQEMRDAMAATDIDLDPTTSKASRTPPVPSGTQLPPAGPTPRAIEAGPTIGPEPIGDTSGPVADGAVWRTDGPNSSFS